MGLLSFVDVVSSLFAVSFLKHAVFDMHFSGDISWILSVLCFCIFAVLFLFVLSMPVVGDVCLLVLTGLCACFATFAWHFLRGVLDVCEAPFFWFGRFAECTRETPFIGWIALLLCGIALFSEREKMRKKVFEK